MIGLDGKQPVHPRGAPYECVRKKLRNELSRFLWDEVDALHLVAQDDGDLIGEGQLNRFFLTVVKLRIRRQVGKSGCSSGVPNSRIPWKLHLGKYDR